MLSRPGKDRSAIRYPSLRVLAHNGVDTLEAHALRLEHLVQQTYGGRHQLLTVEQRRTRLELWKLTNLVRQMDALEDVEIFELGYQCPEQLKRYDRALQATIDLATARRVDAGVLEGARLVHTRLWQVRNVVTRFSEGLS